MRLTRLVPRLRRRPDGPGGWRRARRVLFLDDDPARAEVFLAGNPGAVWVPTAAECIARLAERWDVVHLDHDLGGERFVDPDRDDCGMEVVRWLCRERRPHLRRTRFLVHSHNLRASMTMALHLAAAGFRVEVRPFGQPPLFPAGGAGGPADGRPLAALARQVRRLLRRAPAPRPGGGGGPTQDAP